MSVDNLQQDIDISSIRATMRVTMRDPAIRILHDPPLSGPTNMARDEALLTGAGDGLSPPTLRLYQWIEPTISLGYFQPFAEYEALPAPLSGLAVVRRPTGGGAILHDLELTYSLTLPAAHPLLADGPHGLYQHAHRAIQGALSKMGIAAAPAGASDSSGAARGPFFCFARRHRYDLLVGSEKIAGSAQRRTRKAVLQHGSIVLANRFPQQHPAAPIHALFVEMKKDAHQAFRQTVQEFRANLHYSFLQAVRRPGFGPAVPEPPARPIGSKPGAWLDEELRAADTLIEKYASPAWNRRV